MKPQLQLPQLDTSLLHTHDSTTQLHNSRVSKQTRGQSHTILFLKFFLKDRNIIYDEFFRHPHINVKFAKYKSVFDKIQVEPGKPEAEVSEKKNYKSKKEFAYRMRDAQTEFFE